MRSLAARRLIASRVGLRTQLEPECGNDVAPPWVEALVCTRVRDEGIRDALDLGLALKRLAQQSHASGSCRQDETRPSGGLQYTPQGSPREQ